MKDWLVAQLMSIFFTLFKSHNGPKYFSSTEFRIIINVITQLDQGCVYRERPIATARFCDQNKVCTLSLLLKIQAFKNSCSDWSHVDLFLRLWKIISFNLEVNSSESWRLILGAETLGWISLNYLSVRFISIHIILINDGTMAILWFGQKMRMYKFPGLARSALSR